MQLEKQQIIKKILKDSSISIKDKQIYGYIQEHLEKRGGNKISEDEFLKQIEKYIQFPDIFEQLTDDANLKTFLPPIILKNIKIVMEHYQTEQLKLFFNTNFENFELKENCNYRDVYNKLKKSETLKEICSKKIKPEISLQQFLQNYIQFQQANFFIDDKNIVENLKKLESEEEFYKQSKELIIQQFKDILQVYNIQIETEEEDDEVIKIIEEEKYLDEFLNKFEEELDTENFDLLKKKLQQFKLNWNSALNKQQNPTIMNLRVLIKNYNLYSDENENQFCQLEKILAQNDGLEIFKIKYQDSLEYLDETQLNQFYKELQIIQQEINKNQKQNLQQDNISEQNQQQQQQQQQQNELSSQLSTQLSQNQQQSSQLQGIVNQVQIQQIFTNDSEVIILNLLQEQIKNIEKSKQNKQQQHIYQQQMQETIIQILFSFHQRKEEEVKEEMKSQHTISEGIKMKILDIIKNQSQNPEFLEELEQSLEEIVLQKNKNNLKIECLNQLRYLQKYRQKLNQFKKDFEIDPYLILQLMKQVKHNNNKILDKDCILLIGMTGAGKSTIINTILGYKPKEGQYNNIKETMIYFDECEALVGHEGSCTYLVHPYNLKKSINGKKNILILDSPGAKDNRGIEIEIANQLSIIYALKTCKSLIQVLVFNVIDLKGLRAQNFEATVELFCNMISHECDDESFESILSNTLFIFNKEKEQSLEDFVLPKIQQLIGQSLQKEKQLCEEEKIKSKKIRKVYLEITQQIQSKQSFLFNPTTDGKNNFFQIIKKKEFIEDNEDKFQTSLSREAETNFKLMVNKLNEEIRNLINNNFHKQKEISFYLQIYIELQQNLEIPFISDGLNKIKTEVQKKLENQQNIILNNFENNILLENGTQKTSLIRVVGFCYILTKYQLYQESLLKINNKFSPELLLNKIQEILEKVQKNLMKQQQFDFEDNDQSIVNENISEISLMNDKEQQKKYQREKQDIFNKHNQTFEQILNFIENVKLIKQINAIVKIIKGNIIHETKQQDSQQTEQEIQLILSISLKEYKTMQQKFQDELQKKILEFTKITKKIYREPLDKLWESLLKQSQKSSDKITLLFNNHQEYKNLSSIINEIIREIVQIYELCQKLLHKNIINNQKYILIINQITDIFNDKLNLKQKEFQDTIIDLNNNSRIQVSQVQNLKNIYNIFFLLEKDNKFYLQLQTSLSNGKSNLFGILNQEIEYNFSEINKFFSINIYKQPQDLELIQQYDVKKTTIQKPYYSIQQIQKINTLQDNFLIISQILDIDINLMSNYKGKFEQAKENIIESINTIKQQQKITFKEIKKSVTEKDFKDWIEQHSLAKKSFQQIKKQIITWQNLLWLDGDNNLKLGAHKINLKLEKILGKVQKIFISLTEVLNNKFENLIDEMKNIYNNDQDTQIKSKQNVLIKEIKQLHKIINEISKILFQDELFQYFAQFLKENKILVKNDNSNKKNCDNNQDEEEKVDQNLQKNNYKLINYQNQAIIDQKNKVYSNFNKNLKYPVQLVKIIDQEENFANSEKSLKQQKQEFNQEQTKQEFINEQSKQLNLYFIQQSFFKMDIFSELNNDNEQWNTKQKFFEQALKIYYGQRIDYLNENITTIIKEFIQEKKSKIHSKQQITNFLKNVSYLSQDLQSLSKLTNIGSSLQDIIRDLNESSDLHAKTLKELFDEHYTIYSTNNNNNKTNQIPSKQLQDKNIYQFIKLYSYYFKSNIDETKIKNIESLSPPTFKRQEQLEQYMTDAKNNIFDAKKISSQLFVIMKDNDEDCFETIEGILDLVYKRQISETDQIVRDFKYQLFGKEQIQNQQQSHILQQYNFLDNKQIMFTKANIDQYTKTKEENDKYKELFELYETTYKIQSYDLNQLDLKVQIDCLSKQKIQSQELLYYQLVYDILSRESQVKSVDYDLTSLIEIANNLNYFNQTQQHYQYQQLQPVFTSMLNQMQNQESKFTEILADLIDFYLLFRCSSKIKDQNADERIQFSVQNILSYCKSIDIEINQEQGSAQSLQNQLIEISNQLDANMRNKQQQNDNKEKEIQTKVSILKIKIAIQKVQLIIGYSNLASKKQIKSSNQFDNTVNFIIIIKKIKHHLQNFKKFEKKIIDKLYTLDNELIELWNELSNNSNSEKVTQLQKSYELTDPVSNNNDNNDNLQKKIQEKKKQLLDHEKLIEQKKQQIKEYLQKLINENGDKNIQFNYTSVIQSLSENTSITMEIQQIIIQYIQQIDILYDENKKQIDINKILIQMKSQNQFLEDYDLQYFYQIILKEILLTELVQQVDKNQQINTQFNKNFKLFCDKSFIAQDPSQNINSNQLINQMPSIDIIWVYGLQKLIQKFQKQNCSNLQHVKNSHNLTLKVFTEFLNQHLKYIIDLQTIDVNIESLNLGLLSQQYEKLNDSKFIEFLQCLKKDQSGIVKQILSEELQKNKIQLVEDNLDNLDCSKFILKLTQKIQQDINQLQDFLAKSEFSKYTQIIENLKKIQGLPQKFKGLIENQMGEQNLQPEYFINEHCTFFQQKSTLIMEFLEDTNFDLGSQEQQLKFNNEIESIFTSANEFEKIQQYKNKSSQPQQTQKLFEVLQQLKLQLLQKMNYNLKNLNNSIIQDNSNYNQVYEFILRTQKLSEIMTCFKNIALDLINNQLKLTIKTLKDIIILKEMLNKSQQGQFIVQSAKAFKLFEQLEFQSKINTKNLKSTLDEYKSNKSQQYLNKKMLEQMYQDFDNSFQENRKNFLANTQGLIEQIKKTTKKIINNKQSKQQSIINIFLSNDSDSAISKLLGQIFALWSLKQAGGDSQGINLQSDEKDSNKNENEKNINKQIVNVYKPHFSQVLTILLLKGTSSEQTETSLNALAQIKTGEGKSIVLIALSILYSLFKFNVYNISYSQYLNERDQNQFKDLLQDLGIQDQIRYGTFQDMCRDMIDQDIDIRQQTLHFLQKLNDKNKQDLIFPNYFKDEINKKKGFFENCLILIDEVDVFFTEDFYANFYTPLVLFQHDLISDLIWDIWAKRKDYKALKQEDIILKARNEHQQLFNSFKEIEQILEFNIMSMVEKLNEINDYTTEEIELQFENENTEKQKIEELQQKLIQFVWNQRNIAQNSDQLFQKIYEYKEIQENLQILNPQIEHLKQNICKLQQKFNHIKDNHYKIAMNPSTQKLQLGYIVQGCLNFQQSYGYKTTWHYALSVQEKIIPIDLFKEMVGIYIKCGSFSYAKMINCEKFKIIQGVTGTLENVNPKIKNILQQEYKIEKEFYCPTMFSTDNVIKYLNYGEQLYLKKTKDEYFQEIYDIQAKNIIQKKKNSADDDDLQFSPVIIIFENQEKLFDYEQNYLILKKSQDSYKKLLPQLDFSQKENIIRYSTQVNSYTLTTREFGRGTDFKCYDPEVKQKGVVLIQTFLSKDINEEIQIQGRVARQGDKGNYYLILYIEDNSLLELVNIDTQEFKDAQEIQRLEMKKQIMINHEKKEYRALYDFLDQQRQNYYTNEIQKFQEKIQNCSGQHNQSLQYLKYLQSNEEQKCLQQILQQNSQSKNKIHFLILLDDSYSMEGADWDNQIKGVRQFIEQISINFSKSFLTLIQFNDKCEVILEHQILDKSHVDKFKFKGGGTNFDIPLIKAAEIIQLFFAQTSQAVILFYTDGISIYPNEAVKEFKLLESRKIKYQLYLISKFETRELKQLSNSISFCTLQQNIKPEELNIALQYIAESIQQGQI